MSQIASQMPTATKAAVVLLWLVLLISACLSAALLAFGPLALMYGAIVVFLTGFLIYKTSKGKNWARLVYLVMFLLSVTSISSVVQEVSALPLLKVPQLVAFAIQLMALILLFLPSSNAWFREATRAGPPKETVHSEGRPTARRMLVGAAAFAILFGVLVGFGLLFHGGGRTAEITKIVFFGIGFTLGLPWNIAVMFLWLAISAWLGPFSANEWAPFAYGGFFGSFLGAVVNGALIARYSNFALNGTRKSSAPVS